MGRHFLMRVLLVYPYLVVFCSLLMMVGFYAYCLSLLLIMHLTLCNRSLIRAAHEGGLALQQTAAFGLCGVFVLTPIIDTLFLLSEIRHPDGTH